MSSSSDFDETVDVLIAGTGAAGCAAGASAAIAGAVKVLICEASPKLVGGTTRLAGGGWLWCPNNPFLSSLGVYQQPDEIKQLLRDLAYPQGGVDKGDDELISAFAEDWPAVLKSILDNGVMRLQPVTVREPEDAERVRMLLRRKQSEHPDLEKKVGISEKNFEQLSQLMPSYCAEHQMDMCPTGKVLSPDGSTTSLQLEKACKKRNCEIRMDARVVDLIFDNQKNVIGAIVSSENGKLIKKIRSLGGVIFASGGFSHNRELLEENFGGTKFAPVGSCSSKTNVGDFVSIATKYQIPLSGMDAAWLKQVILPFKFPKRLGIFFMNGDSYMVVDRSGNRFACDKDFYQQRGMQMLHNESRRCVFFIFDERSWELFEGPIKSLGSAYPTLDDSEDCIIRGRDVKELTQGIKTMLTKVCSDFTLEENFQDSLEKQISRFNEMAKTGIDTEFGRGNDTAQFCWSVPRAKDNHYPNKTMYPINANRLCAVVLGLSTLDTKGGPRINKNGQILGANNKPIPGLYGSGNCVRSSTRHSYPASGVTLSNAIFFGWNAGKDAAQRSLNMKSKI